MLEYLAYLIILFGALSLAYNRASLYLWDGFIMVALLLLSYFSILSTLAMAILWVILLAILLFLNIPFLRQKFLTNIAYKIAQKKLPTISESERLALESGTVTWDAELFSGMPKWSKLFDYKPSILSTEEKVFMDGPLEELCCMGNPWDMWHKDLAIRKDMETFASKNGFMGLKIPKKYGGKEFSYRAIWDIVMKSERHVGPLGYLIVIANSIGSADLLVHYGTDAQKKYFLPRLAKGLDTSCFALTSPIAGSDATAIEDYGIVCKGVHKGKEVLGIKLNFNKRYITLGPIATIMGLAFRLYDPDHLVGNKEDIGISIALVPTDLPGVTHGRYHYPIGAPFPNGPLKGKDVFVPMDNLLGGLKMAGKAWMMLTHSLAGGRATSLPTGAVGSLKHSFYVTSVYTKIRKQFGVTIGNFEGVQEKLAELTGYTYLSDATRALTFSQLDAGENPAVTAAISKYNTTELARRGATIALDLHGGKGVMVGPHNYIAYNYLIAPVGVTVEGANTMTRNLIVFGQGAIRCHPYILHEMNALQEKNLTKFDTLVMQHMNYTMSNHVRSFVLGLSKGQITKVPTENKITKRYLQNFTHLSASFSLLSDIALMTLGGKLKFKESLSGKFADVLSMLFMGSAVLKKYHDQGYPESLLPIVKWSSEWALYNAQSNLDAILNNFPNRLLSLWLRFFIFPLGKRYKAPSDKLSHEVAQLVQSSKDVRELLAEGIYLTPTKENIITQLEEALTESQKVADLQKRISKATQEGQLKAYTYIDRIAEARKNKVITSSEEKNLLAAHQSLMKIINVDDFSLDELNKEK